ncbi:MULTISPECIES: phosphatase PAP2 family protein [unclassified Variovorax]|uniref:phosphatase PAP2 family protein n=1 Tax=unclassified Variovorax TaxID=663243 RepID=UPI003ECFA079
MKALNLALLQWIAAGYEPSPWLLPVASAIALGAAWAGMALMGWAAWRRPSERGYVMATLAFAVATAVIAHAIAASLNLPRPFMLGLSPAYIPHGARGSLPSAHAAVMFTVALMFLLRPRLRDLGIGMAALAAITGWARVYVGVHFPADIVAGLLLAVVMTGVFVGVQRLWRRHVAPRIARGDLRVRAPAFDADPQRRA